MSGCDGGFCNLNVVHAQAPAGAQSVLRRLLQAFLDRFLRSQLGLGADWPRIRLPIGRAL